MLSNRLFDLAELAEASYSLFDVSSDKYKEALKNNDFSETQATEFLTHWEIIHHQPDTSCVGYSATLFKRKDDDPTGGFQQGQLVYAIRGTAGGRDLLSADIGDLTTDGLAMDRQITGGLAAHSPRGGSRCWG